MEKDCTFKAFYGDSICDRCVSSYCDKEVENTTESMINDAFISLSERFKKVKENHAEASKRIEVVGDLFKILEDEYEKFRKETEKEEDCVKEVRTEVIEKYQSGKMVSCEKRIYVDGELASKEVEKI